MSILKADPGTRRKLIYINVIGILIIIAISEWIMPEFGEYLKQKQPEAAIRILLIFMSVCALLPLLIVAHMCYHVHRIYETGQWPLPGAKVYRDTEIVTGDAARRKARPLIILSVIITLLSLIGGIYFPYSLYKSIENHKVKQKVVASVKMEVEEIAMQQFTLLPIEKIFNRVAGGFSPPAPTPPGMRVRTGRFTEITGP